MSGDTAMPKQVWQQDPAGPQEEPAAVAPDEPEYPTIEEPGYGHGV